MRLRFRFTPRGRHRLAVVVALALVAAAGGSLAAPAVTPADTARFVTTASGETLWLSAPIGVSGDRVPAALPGRLVAAAVARTF